MNGIDFLIAFSKAVAIVLGAFTITIILSGFIALITIIGMRIFKTILDLWEDWNNGN